MPVRLRITLLFSLLVFVIFSIVCLSIYFIAVRSRQQTIQSRLVNRALTTARLLSQEEIFDLERIRQIDSFTTITLKNKIVQAYDYQNARFYSYKDNASEEFNVSNEILNEARINGRFFFEQNGKEAIAYHYADDNSRMVVVSAAEDVDGHANLEKLRSNLLLSFLSGNLIVLAAGYVFAGRLIRPVQKITQDVADISAHNLVRRLQTGKTKDEWHRLAETLNELLNRLQESFDMQRRFISNASHELSTPLTSISSQLEVALQRERTAEEYRKVIQSTYQDVKHMSNLTLTLLDFAKASGNAGGLELSTIRVDEIVLELPAQVVRMNPAYAATITFDDLPEEEEALLVYGNRPLLETALKNILVNACKYTPGHQATVRLKTGNNKVIIEVEDKGIGIPQEKIKDIFQPFYRVEGSNTAGAGGFGLGLSLSNRIIKLHNGNIEVESRENEGSTFRVELPVAGHS
ncbi:MAG TPA: HAMP domain-containing sensor histidine kinase [Flavisolibacter sp.]|jgi:signal transduction histidine kinase|nr:HAMP domain-containing sensor histidine kinase [Flavisolibacter sp.]